MNYSAELLHDLHHRKADVSFAPRQSRVGPIASLKVLASNGSSWLAEVGIPRDVREPFHVDLYATPDPDALLIVAGDTYYWVPVLHPADYQDVTPSGSLPKVRPLASQQLIFLMTDQEIVALGPRGPKWETRRIALDGIRVDSVTETHLTGVADFDFNPRAFTVDLRTGEVEDGMPMAHDLGVRKQRRKSGRWRFAVGWFGNYK